MTLSNPKGDSPEKEGEILLDYLPKLVRLAEKNMSGRLMQKIGPDDMADSVLGSILRMMRQGKLPIALDQSPDFWRFLVAVSLNKIRKKVRHFDADKRNLNQEIAFGSDMPGIEELIADRTEPDEAGGVRVAQVLEKLRESLDDEDREILRGKLEGLTFKQIAEGMAGGTGRSEKTAQRRWAKIEERLQKIVEEMDWNS